MSDQDDAGVQHPPITPRSSLGSGALSYSSGSSISPSTSSSSSQGSAKAAVSECLGAWLNYLQVLNNLCASGYRLAQTMSALEQWGQQQQSEAGMAASVAGSLPGSQAPSAPGATTAAGAHNLMTTHLTGAWDDLARATAVATSTVKSHIISVLQDFITASNNTSDQEIDWNRTRDHNQQIISESAQTMINLQHQFCVASYDSFSSLMCCFVCQAPVGFPHDPDCAMIHQKTFSTTDQRSQTPSPHFGTVMSHRSGDQQYRTVEGRGVIFGSGSTQASSEHGCGPSGISGIEQTRGPSPHQEIRGPSPIQGFLDNIRGPLPNPGHLMGMKAPFYRGSRSPLNFPLFPLNGQRRWSEAAAGEVRGGESTIDVESQMRRWSMPWEATKTDKNTVSWHQTRIMPISKLAVPTSKTSSDRSQSTTPDSFWQPSVTSQDGLAEAIQLLSCRPSRNYPIQQQQSLPSTSHPPIGSPFIEEPATYEMWSSGTQDRLPYIKFPKRDQDRDDNNPPAPPSQ